jgi:F420-dependent oxidoreductase-like protein
MAATVRHPVEFGIYIPQLAFGYDDMLSRARAAEETGFASFWLYDHLYGPMLPQTPAFEGWTLATALLTQTERIRVGHLVLCNNFRHPALLAKMATSLDVISGGRLDFGIGSGSVEAEHLETGLPWGSFAERSERLGEGLEIITSMFANERTTFEGKHYQVRDVPNLPPPVQRPRPPIHVGGVGEKRTIPLVARYADVWNVPTYALADWEPKRAALERECAAIGRDPAEIRLSIEAVMVLAPDDDALAEAMRQADRRYPGSGFGLHEGGFIGTPDAMIERIQSDVDRGVSLFVFFLHDRGNRATLELFAERVMPAFV